MLHPSTKRLIDKLNDMTRKQRVAWTESDDGSVTHDTEGYRVILTPEPHAIFLTDALGRQIETCTPDEFADDTDADGRPYAKFVAELFREAHRHARGTEKAIRTLLQTLDAAEAVAAPPAIAAPPTESRDDADATEDLIDETAPIEGEQAMAEAVASMAEQINNPAPPHLSSFASETAHAGSSGEATLALEPIAEPASGFIAAPSVPQETATPAPAEPERAAQDNPASPGAAYGGGFFGAYGGFGQYTGPPDETPATPQEPEIAPAPEPRGAPVTGQRISLSSIPYGFGLGTLNPPPTNESAPPAPAAPQAAPTPEPTPVPPKRMIDGTVDLPDAVGEPGAGWVVRDAARDDDADAAFPTPSLDDAGDGNSPDPDAPAPGPSANPARRFNPWN